MMMTLTNLASTLAFSAIASGLGVFVPILWRVKESLLWYNTIICQFVKAIEVMSAISEWRKLACFSWNTHFRTDRHLANWQPSALYWRQRTSRSSSPWKFPISRTSKCLSDLGGALSLRSKQVLHTFVHLGDPIHPSLQSYLSTLMPGMIPAALMRSTKGVPSSAFW